MEISFMFFINCTLRGVEYAVRHLLLTTRVHARQLQKSFVFNFNYSVWMNKLHIAIPFVAYVQQHTLNLIGS